ncbi:hypothetical protein VTI74DRAFT_8700 [Chaetomium olivicolor]
MTEYIDLPPSLRKRFYEPVILSDALKSLFRREGWTAEPDLEAGVGKSPQQIYYCFLNKLSQICDNLPHTELAKTVSAIVALDSGTIEYRFASNQRDNHELATVREYLTDILNILGQVTDDEANDRTHMADILSIILRKVLAFNRPRVEGYLEDLCRRANLAFCITSSAADSSAEGQDAFLSLQSLEPQVEAARNASPTNDEEFARHSEALLQTLAKDYGRSLEEYMKKKTRGDNTVSDSPWGDVRHSLGRLLSYFIAIKVLISARNYWPQLFVDFEVTTIPSSVPLPEPPSIRRSAVGIISRMSRNKSTLNAYQHLISSLQAHDFDKRIKDRVHPSHFRPIVHAEVNLLASVIRSQAECDEDDEAPRFFNEARFGRYIGSSKPTCLLCHLYFSLHPLGVKCRETHGNLYPNWRAPDVTVADGEEAEEQRREILEGMIKEIRKETARAIEERSSQSQSKETTPKKESGLGQIAKVKLAERVVQNSYDAGAVKAQTGGLRKPSPEKPESGDDEVEEDDEGGGARL